MIRRSGMVLRGGSGGGPGRYICGEGGIGGGGGGPMARARARVWGSDLREAELPPAWSSAIAGTGRWFSGHCADRRPLARRRWRPRWVVAAETTTPARAPWWAKGGDGNDTSGWTRWGVAASYQREKWARVFLPACWGSHGRMGHKQNEIFVSAAESRALFSAHA
jgi:hypothetical protein